MGRAGRTVAIVALALAGCSNPVLPASTPTSDAVFIQLNTTTATLPLMTDLTRTYAQVNPAVNFEVSVGNFESAAVQALNDPPVYFLTNHLPPPEESVLWGAPIGQDGIAIITHATNPVTDLAIEQVRGIYQGRVVSWAGAGGASQTITVISREMGSGTRAEFNRLIMGERRISQSAHIAPSSAAVVTSVARQPGAIGYVSMSHLDPSVHAVRLNGVAATSENVYNNTYPLRTTLFFAGPAEPEDENLRAFFAWVQSPEGQAVVARHYTPLLLP